MSLSGPLLIHEVGKRILQRYLEQQGARDVQLSAPGRSDPIGVDIRRMEGGRPIAAKVKVDCYCGMDAEKIADRALTFYRGNTSSYALESLTDATTRTAGWVQSSMAEELLYYRLAIARPEAEVAALLAGTDMVFFAELGVEYDELRVVPMRELRDWFERSNDRYMSRPVLSGDRSAWYRIVPMSDVDSAVSGVRVITPIYRRVRGDV